MRIFAIFTKRSSRANARPAAGRPRPSLRAFSADRSGGVALEGVVAIGLIAVAFLAIAVFGALFTQARQGSSATYVLGDLITSHVGALSCADLNEYFLAAHETYVAGASGTDSAWGDTGSREYRVHAAGILVREEDGELVPAVIWQSYRDTQAEFTVGESVPLANELAYEGAFYVMVRGRTRSDDPTDLLFSAVLERDTELVFAPRYSAVLTLGDNAGANCQNEEAQV